MPPAIDSEVSDRRRSSRNFFPTSMNVSRMAYANTHSRSTTRRRRDAGTLRSTPFTSGTLPNGSSTNSSSKVAE